MERKARQQHRPPATRGKSRGSINRWGHAPQALTGNFMPYFSCGAVSRSRSHEPQLRGAPLVAGRGPYDYGLALLPYHQPMTGTDGDACDHRAA